MPDVGSKDEIAVVGFRTGNLQRVVKEYVAHADGLAELQQVPDMSGGLITGKGFPENIRDIGDGQE